MNGAPNNRVEPVLRTFHSQNAAHFTRCSRGALGVRTMSAIRRAIEEIVSWFRPVRINVLPEGMTLLDAGGSVPDGFHGGVEILSDDKTPMSFVVDVLQSELNMCSSSAIRTTVYIHNKGGVLLPLGSKELAGRVADAILSRARAESHPLFCRAIDAQQGTQDRRCEDSA